MIYSSAQLATALNTAKCCLGDYSCRMLSKGINGQEYYATMTINMELSLYIFFLTGILLWPDEECADDQQIEKIVHRINKICSCDCTAVTTAQTAQHTSEDHTILLHTL